MSDSSTVPGAASPRIHFVTGKLAEFALRGVLEKLARDVGFQYTLDVLPITVAALMTPAWVARHLQIPSGTTRIVLPGYCAGNLDPIRKVVASIPVDVGPRDLHDLPEFFGHRHDRPYGEYRIQILAEVNHAPRLELRTIRELAQHYVRSGADIIDVGCDPGDPWPGVGECVRALRDDGCRVSIDSLHPREISDAVKAGAELVLSVNSQNRHAAADWGCEVVVIPDEPVTLAGLDETVERLALQKIPLRIDPILEPIGCGFAASLGRYLDVRKRYPEAEMMMGIGNLTELTDCDSAAVNVMLLGFCEEVGIRSVLTTEVINWARSSVRECDVARKLVHAAVKRGVPPKKMETGLVMLRDARVTPFGDEQLARLAQSLKDNNYRIFAENGQLHLMAAGLHLIGSDPFDLFEQLCQSGPDGEPPRNLNQQHAFYLGYEMAKAVTALTLSKAYRQDQSLDWGILTVPEQSHRASRKP